MKFERIVLLVAVLVFAVNGAFCEDVEKAARAEVSKAIKAKLIKPSDIGFYYEKINSGKGAEIIKELQALASSEIVVSENNPVGWRLDGNGKFPKTTPPLSWGMDKNGSKKNIAWITEMPYYSPGSLIVSGDKLFATANSNSLVCLDKVSGRILWVRSVSLYDAAEQAERDQNRDVFSKLDDLAKKRDELRNKIPGSAPNEIFNTGSEMVKVEAEMEKIICEADKEKYKNNGMTYSDGGYMSAAPASDGTYVYVWNAWGVTACFDMKGERKWIRFDKLRPQEHGNYASPLLVGNKVIIHIGKQYRALDKKTGKEIWTSELFKTKEDWYGYWYGSHSYTRIGGEDVIIAGNGSLLTASNGKYFLKGDGMQCTSPVLGDGFVSWASGIGSAGPFFYKLPSNTSNNTSPGIKRCSFKKAKAIGSQGDFISASSLIHDKLLYTIGNDPFLYVYDLVSDKLVYQQTLDFGITQDRKDRPYGSGISASPTFAGGKIFIWGFQGTTIIVEPGPVYKEVAKNTIEKRIQFNHKSDNIEGTVSNPWFEGNRIYYRAQKYIYCIEGK